MERTELWRGRIVSVRAWSILAVYLALSGVFCWPIFVQPLAQGAGDWDQHTLYYAAVVRNAAFGDLPFWNPWYCRGNVLARHAAVRCQRLRDRAGEPAALRECLCPGGRHTVAPLRPTAPTVAEHQLGTPGGPRVHRSFMLDSMLAGVSPLDCYEPLRVSSVAQPGPMAISGDGDVTITGQTFSPNRVMARVVVGREPARVILNENFASGWTSTAGRVRAVLPTRQPSVELPVGYSDIAAFSYVPPGLGIGLAILAVAVGVSVVVWRRSTSSDGGSRSSDSTEGDR